MTEKFDRVLHIITVCLTICFIFGFAAAFWLTPDKGFSEQENRYLQQLPKLESESFLSGEWMTEIGEYYADQFPLRNTFMGIRAMSELALGKMQNNDVVMGSDGYLVAREYNPDYTTLEKNLKALRTFATKMEGQDIPCTIALAGRTVDVMTEVLPPLYPTETDENLWKTALDMVKNQHVLDLRTSLRELNQSKVGQLYYFTDHHWTSLGAYYGYANIVESWGITPMGLDYFDATQVSDAFYGTTWSSAGTSWVKPDRMEFFRYQGDMDYTTYIQDTGVSFDGFYDMSYLEQKDKYSSFISGNNGLVTVTAKGEEERETLLLIKDSFAHSMVPFLAIHYDLVIVDMRYYVNTLGSLIEEYGVDRALVMVNMETLIDTYQFGLLTK